MARHLADVLLTGEKGFSRDGSDRWVLEQPRSIPVVREAASATYAGGRQPLHAHSFVVVDVETTGTRVTFGDRITEIAAVAVEGGRITREYGSLVNPGKPIPVAISRLTHITQDMVRRAPSFADVAPQVAEVLEGKVFVAHNASFDWRFVSSELARATGHWLTGERLCTVRMSRSLLPALRRRSLDAVARYFGVEIEPTERHRAGGDARATAKVLIGLLALAHDHGIETLEQLLALGTATRRRRRRRQAMPHWMTRDDSA